MIRACDATMFWSATGGGVRRYIETKRQWLASSGRDVRHLLVIPGRQDACSKDAGGDIRTVRSSPVPLAPGYLTPLSPGAVERALSSWRPDFVECGCPFVMRRGASAWRESAGGAVFDYYHAYFPLNYSAVLAGRLPVLARAFEAWGWRFLRRSYADSTRIFVASPCVRERLSREGITRTELAPLGVDLDLFTPAARPGAGSAEGDRTARLLFVGRLNEEKGLSAVIGCFELLRRERSATLTIVGDGVMRPKVEKLAGSDPSVVAAGFLEPAGLAVVYRGSTILVSGAPAETLGLTFLEALASGIPVVGLEGSGLIGTFPRAVSRAVPRRDPELLASAVAELLDDPPPPGLCRESVLDYAWDRRLAHILDREIELSGASAPQGTGGRP